MKAIAISVLVGAILMAAVASYVIEQPTPIVLVAPVYQPDYSGVLLVEVGYSSGSCFVVAQRGDWWYAVTAKHVVDSGMPLTVDGYGAEVVRADPERDVALIRFEAAEARYPIYEFARAHVGSPCVSVGWGMGHKLIHKGYIVATDLLGCVAANGGVVPGCSGGALFDGEGRVLGVVSRSPMHGPHLLDNTVLYVPARFAEALVVTIGSNDGDTRS